MKNILLILFLTIAQQSFAQITFSADIESGNLSSVSTSDSITYFVTTKADPGIDGGSTRWFYFKIWGVKDKEIRVSFFNTDVTKAMYSYDNQLFHRFSDSEVPNYGEFVKTFDEDTVFVAYYTPYNYSFLQQRIEEWKNNKFVSIDTLGITPQSFPIQELKVTDSSIPDSNKKHVWIHARTHPSETPSSWQFDGIMQELLSGKEVIDDYMKKIVFYMVPFTNPDGVYFGRSRVNYEGINLEPNWDKTEEFTSQEVKILRARMKELNDIQPFSVFLNLHSQASSYCTFWIHTASSTSPYFYRREYQFSNLNVSDNPYFVKNDYSESNLRPVYPEGWLWDNYGEQVMALTYETPYNNYFKSSSEPFIEVDNDNLFEIGKRTVYAISEYLEVQSLKHYIIDNSDAQVVGTSTNYTVGTEFFGDDFEVLDAGAEDSYFIYQTENLPSGMYDVAAWWPTSEGNSFETVYEITAGDNYYEDTKTQKINGGQWNYLSTIELNSEGSVSIKMHGNNTGLVVADAFRLIYAGNVTGFEDEKIPNQFTLYQNYPNPFNPTTTIRYIIPGNATTRSNTSVQLIIYDILGREVETLVNTHQGPGEYEVTFDASGLASGNYIYRLTSGDFVETRKMVLLK